MMYKGFVVMSAGAVSVHLFTPEVFESENIPELVEMMSREESRDAAIERFTQLTAEKQEGVPAKKAFKMGDDFVRIEDRLIFM